MKKHTIAIHPDTYERLSEYRRYMLYCGEKDSSMNAAIRVLLDWVVQSDPTFAERWPHIKRAAETPTQEAEPGPWVQKASAKERELYLQERK